MRFATSESGISIDFFGAVQEHAIASTVATDAHTVSIGIFDFQVVASIRAGKTDFGLGSMEVGVVFASGD